jgi:predicted nucleotidyltransferase
MVDKTQILKDLKFRLKSKLGNGLFDLILFGSYAQSSEKEHSDYDVLIILNVSAHWKLKNLIRDICYDVSLDKEIFIDSKIISRHDLETKFWGKHPLFTDAIKHGIHA